MEAETYVLGGFLFAWMPYKNMAHGSRSICQRQKTGLYGCVFCLAGDLRTVEVSNSSSTTKGWKHNGLA